MKTVLWGWLSSIGYTSPFFPTVPQPDALRCFSATCSVVSAPQCMVRCRPPSSLVWLSAMLIRPSPDVCIAFSLLSPPPRLGTSVPGLFQLYYVKVGMAWRGTILPSPDVLLHSPRACPFASPHSSNFECSRELPTEGPCLNTEWKEISRASTCYRLIAVVPVVAQT